MTPPLLIVGEAPGNYPTPAPPFFPYPEKSAGGRLLRISEYPFRVFRCGVEKVDLLDYYPGDAWERKDFLAAKRRVKDITQRAWHTVFLMGRKAAEVFEAFDPDKAWFSETVGDWAKRIVLFPHPSARNHVWNYADTQRIARDLFAETREEVVSYFQTRGKKCDEPGRDRWPAKR